MNIDGFRPEHKQAFQGFSPGMADAFFASVNGLSRRAHVRIEGLERIPQGRALLVANHCFGYDIVFLVAAIEQSLRRRVWVLGDHLFWKFPFLRRFVAAIGVVDGTRQNVELLLARDQLVLVLPGGLREAVKPRELRYQLLWGQRYGFVQAAIMEKAPLVPVASVGADDLFDFVGNAYRRGQRWLGRDDIPLPRPKHLLALPHLSPFSFSIGEPIPATLSPEQAADMPQVKRLRREIEGAIHELIETELARRLSLDLT